MVTWIEYCPSRVDSDEGVEKDRGSGTDRSAWGDQTTYLWMVVVLAPGFGALVWFSASIRTVILRLEPDGRLASLAFAGGLLTAVMFLAGIAVEAQGFFESSALVQLDDAGLSAVHATTAVVTGGLVGLTTITRGVMLLAVTLAGFRFGAQPRWLSWVTGVVAALSWLGIFVLAQPGEAEGSAAGLIWFLAFVAFPIWALIASIELVVRLGRSAG